MLSIKFNQRKILTQKIVSEATEIAEYSIRDHFVNLLEPIFLKNKTKANEELKVYNKTQDNEEKESKKDDSILPTNKSNNQKDILGTGNSRLLRLAILNFLSFHMRNRSQVVNFLETSFEKKSIKNHAYSLFKHLEDKKLIECLTPNLHHGKLFRLTTLGREILENQPRL